MPTIAARIETRMAAIGAELFRAVEEYKQQIEVADGWIEKALAMKKIKAARSPRQ